MKLLSNRRRAMFSNRKNRVSGKARAPLAGSGRGLIYRGLILFVAVAGLMMALLAGAYRERPVLAQQTPTPTPAATPDYSNADDILNGRRNLLRDDDLALYSVDHSEYNEGQAAGYVLLCVNSSSSR